MVVDFVCHHSSQLCLTVINYLRRHPDLILTHGKIAPGTLGGDANARAKHLGFISSHHGSHSIASCEAAAGTCVRAVSAAQGEVRVSCHVLLNNASLWAISLALVVLYLLIFEYTLSERL